MFQFYYTIQMYWLDYTCFVAYHNIFKIKVLWKNFIYYTNGVPYMALFL